LKTFEKKWLLESDSAISLRSVFINIQDTACQKQQNTFS